MGLRCTHCNNPDKPLEEVMDGMDPSPVLKLRCPTCSADDFQMTLQTIKSLERPDDDTYVRLTELKRRFDDLKRLCFPGSWYLLESGNPLFRACLNGMAESEDRREQDQYASKALLILNYLSNTSGALEVKGIRMGLWPRGRWSVNQLTARLEHLSRLSFPDPSSFREKGDPLEEAFRGWLGPCEDRKLYATQTVVTMEDALGTSILSSTRIEAWRWTSTSLEHRLAIQLCQIIKLQFFLYSKPPASAFLFLEKCFSFLWRYYPGQLELINDIFATMQPMLILD